MSLLDQQIDKAKARAQGLDLRKLAADTRDLPPVSVAPPDQVEARRRFLKRDLGDARLFELTFERIIEGNELQPVNYLQLGALAARAVCRIELIDVQGQRCGWASGFLIAPGVLLTNNHVFPSAAMAGRSRAQFDVELDVFGADKPMAVFGLDPGALFYSDPALDFAVVAVAPVGQKGEALADYGFLPLIDATGKVVDGEWLTIIQHPGGERKQVCVRENKLLTRTAEVLWYSTDTQGGSSGSPVFNNSWQVVALHHKGVPEEKNGQIQTVDGRDYDPGRDDEAAIKWIANEGIRISRIVDTLRRERPGHSLLADVFVMTPERAHDVVAALLEQRPASIPEIGQLSAPSAKKGPQMSRSITVTLDLTDDGGVSVRPARPGGEAAFVEAARTTTPKRSAAPDIDVPFNFDYDTRNGYQPDFLGAGFEVYRPDAGLALPNIAHAKLKATPGSTDPDDYILAYSNFSVMMHKTRRLALWTAANVDGGQRFSIGRTSDTWRWDPRIAREAQLGDFYYKKNQFDRGHLTRREDMEYGANLEAAVAAADDTCHWSNCSPQHAKFNELGYLWQNLEKHILEGSIKAKKFGAQVMTGPILDEGDPTWERFPDIQYPLRFWKIAVALTSKNELFAAGFILDQSAAIGQFGIEAAGEVPFGPFETFQVPIAEIENLTGLSFTYGKAGKVHSLRDVDPLAKARPTTPARRSAGANEAALVGQADAPPAYVRLEGGASIIR